MLMHTAFLVITSVTCVVAYEIYVPRIPNGKNVTYKNCNSEILEWQQVGHVAIQHIQGEPFGRNAFGQAFASANHVWTTELCNADSDGDGMTNGEELGFPSCTYDNVVAWNNDPDSVTLTKPIGHPGICEKKENIHTGVDCDKKNKKIVGAVCPTGGVLSQYTRIKATLDSMNLSQIFSIWSTLVQQRMNFG